MMGFLAPSMPSAPAPPPLPPAATPPTMANTAVKQAGASQRAKAAAGAGMGFDNTLSAAPGPTGAAPAVPTARKALTGQ